MDAKHNVLLKTLGCGVAIVIVLVSAYRALAQPQAVSSKNGMVVTEQRLASQIGADILRSGGNAIDAAVAVGYALAVVNPCCGNIGGGGFMTIHLANGSNYFLNFREKAPLAATKNMYLDAQGNVIPNASTLGYSAVAVPGTVLGLDTALQRFGTMSRQQVMAPAIALAKNGYTLTPYQANLFSENAQDFRAQPNIAAIFLRANKLYQAGDQFIQTDLANTLQLIANQGPAAFYHGPIAQEIVAASAAQHGLLTLADFAHYNVELLNPIQCDYRGYTIISAPPPSSGGIGLCEMLNILENIPTDSLQYRSAFNIKNKIEAMRFSFNDRDMQLGDPDFVSNPTDKLLAKSYAQAISAHIQAMHFAEPASVSREQHSQTDTTHYSILDKQGNAVAVTYTLNGFFGAKIIAGNTGFFLNDEMDDFTAKPNAPNNFNLIQSDINAIQPSKRPLSSMTPTVVMKDGKVFMVIGSPGGPRIITAVLLAITNVIDYHMNISQAIDAPRFHYQSQPDTVYTEPFAIPFFSSLLLEHLGYHFTAENPWSAIEAIAVDPKTGSIYGANDLRRPDGAASGY